MTVPGISGKIREFAGELSNCGFDTSFYFYSAPSLYENFSSLRGCFRIYAPSGSFGKISPSDKGQTQFIEIPPYINKKPSSSTGENSDGKLLVNIGDFEALPEKGILCGDLSLNTSNSSSADAYCGIFDRFSAKNASFESITLSPELNDGELLPTASEICKAGKIRPEIIVYGRIPLMRCEHCIVSGAVGSHPGKNILKSKDNLPPSFNCNNCAAGGTFYLRSEKGGEFPVLPLRAVCGCVILSPGVIDKSGILAQLLELDKKTVFRFNIFDEVL